MGRASGPSQPRSLAPQGVVAPDAEEDEEAEQNEPVADGFALAVGVLEQLQRVLQAVFA